MPLLLCALDMRVTKFIILILLVLQSCKESKTLESPWLDQATLESSGEWILEIDNTTPRYSNLFSYYDDDEILYLYNRLGHTLYTYELNQSQPKSILKLKSEGPDGVMKPDAIKVLSQDSILFLNNSTKLLTIIDSEGHTFYTKKILKDDENGLPLRSSILHQNGKIYVPVANYIYTNKNISSKSLMIMDLETSEKDFLLDTPKELQNINDWADRYYIRDGVLVGDSIYVSTWSMSKDLKAINLYTLKSRKLSYSSKYINNAKRASGTFKSLEEKSDFQLQNTWNEAIFYAEHQNLVLRSHSIGKYIPDGGSRYDKLKTINGDENYVVTELFDNTLNKIGEVPGVTFIEGIFSSKTGLYIEDFLFDMNNENIVVFKKYEKRSK
jgi:hypothetical protein